jgi:type I restriction enzyme, S subunit
MVELDQSAELRGGSTPRRDERTYWNGDIPWVTPSDLPDATAGVTEVDTTADAITEEGLNACSASLLPPGTVLFSSRATIGKIGVATVPLATNQGFANLIPRSGVDSRYLAWCLHFFSDRIATLAGSTTFKEVSKSSLRRFRIPLPPPSEQRRIVESLDHANRIRRLRTQADTKAERILPALLLRGLGEPLGWATDPQSQPLGDLVDLVSGGTPSKRIREYWRGDVPWVSPKDMKRDFLSDSQDHVSQVALKETNLKLIDPGNALIVVRGMILARDVPVALNLVRVVINQDMKALVPKTSAVSGRFVWAMLTLARSHLQSLVRTAGHGTRKLDTPDLLQFRVIAPSESQVAAVESVVEQHRVLGERRESARETLEKLFAVLLNRAFTGSLTAAWRQAHMNELIEEIEHQAKTLGEAT